MRLASVQFPSYTWLCTLYARGGSTHAELCADPAFRIAKISTPFRDPTITEHVRAAYRVLGAPE